MKNFFFILLAITTLSASAQTVHKKHSHKASALKPSQKHYEMKQYYFVMLTKGKRRDEITDTNVINKLQEGHMANIGRMADLGKLIVAGPFGDDGNWRGIFIFDCKTQEEVEELLKSDPAIAAGRLDYKIHLWWTAKGTVLK